MKENKMKGESIFKQIFGDKRIVGLAGSKNVGKTNNLVSAIVDLRERGIKTKIYAYGLDQPTFKFLNKYGVDKVTNLNQLINKRNAILILDEFQDLHLNDPKYRKKLGNFSNFVYHKKRNIKVIFCSPDPKEFNSVIGSIIERWLIKSIRVDQCINGSQLKKAIEDHGDQNEKVFDNIIIEPNEAVLINDEKGITIDFPYIKEADQKQDLLELV